MLSQFLTSRASRKSVLDCLHWGKEYSTQNMRYKRVQMSYTTGPGSRRERMRFTLSDQLG